MPPLGLLSQSLSLAQHSPRIFSICVCNIASIKRETHFYWLARRVKREDSNTWSLVAAYNVYLQDKSGWFLLQSSCLFKNRL